LLAIGWLLVGIVVVEPWIGVRLWRRFRSELGARADARLRLYRRILTMEWVYAALVVATVASLPRPWIALGLVAPSLARGSEALRTSLMGLVVGVSIGLLLPVVTARGRAFVERAMGDASALLPGNGGERAWFVAVAITAGICEELLYRGFLFFWIARFTPSATVAVVASALVFGAAHIYQGRAGLIGTTVLGAGLGGLYVWTGSLWPSIVLHALIDLRAALLTAPATSRSAPSAAAAASDRAAT
jgi:membrane protease YdiL (CAAX protease family)